MTSAEFSSMSAWDIAERIGCSYLGDMNPIDHDGTFYDGRDWEAYGHASCVAFTRLPDENNLLVECGTISRPDDLTDCSRYIGADPNGASAEMEIEAALAYWGFEVQEDFGGPYMRLFKADANGDVDAGTVWESVRGWLEFLGDGGQ